MVKQLLDLANYKVRDLSELHMKEHFRGLNNLAPSPMIVPLQSSLTVTLPSAVVNQFEHKPFPSNLPVMQSEQSVFVALTRVLPMWMKGFDDVVEVMNSLAKPRKIVVYDNFGQAHSFLCKPHDDLRKDARLMEFNSMINKLLKKDTESRRRHLGESFHHCPLLVLR